MSDILRGWNRMTMRSCEVSNRGRYNSPQYYVADGLWWWGVKKGTRRRAKSGRFYRNQKQRIDQVKVRCQNGMEIARKRQHTWTDIYQIYYCMDNYISWIANGTINELISSIKLTISPNLWQPLHASVPDSSLETPDAFIEYPRTDLYFWWRIRHILLQLTAPILGCNGSL